MNLPAGIEKGFEIYVHNDNLRVFIDGKRSDYLNLSFDIRKLFINEMAHSAHVVDRLSEMGILPSKMELKFVACRYGSLNGTPDLQNTVLTPDAPNCDKIGNCPGYGIVCLIPCNLTRREYLIVSLIALGKQDKEICDSLDIAMPTCHTYKERIRDKLHLNNRVEIALWAQKLGIV